MLTTDKAHELPSFPLFAGAGVAAWRAVSLELGVSYIFVSYAFKEGRGWIDQASILWRQEDILSFFQDVKADKSRKILEVSLLLPVRIGKLRSLRWTPLSEIWTGQLDGMEPTVAVYVAMDGQRFGGASNLNVDRFVVVEKVYDSRT